MAHRLLPDRKSPRSKRRDRIHAVVAILLAALFTAPLLRAGESDASSPNDPDAEALSGSTNPNEPLVPESSTTIRFSHDKHTGVACATCHAGVSTSERASDDLMPAMTTCAECHAGSKGAPKVGTSDGSTSPPAPRLRDCSGCHVGYDQSVEAPVDSREDWRDVQPPPMIPPRPESRLEFDHAKHLQIIADDGPAESETCGRCHGDTPDEPTMPDLSTCRECHGSEDSEGSLKPTNHTVDWLERHGSVARADASSCEDCHTEDECADCHDEQAAAPFSVHPPNFDTLHAVDARSNLDDCAECHTIQTFCRRCHAETKFAPNDSNPPPPRFDAHPPNWTEPGAPNNHAVMARRNIQDCASCHTERDCVSCHRGVNPHPPEFRLKCDQWLEANPAPCAKCHGNLDELRGKCL